MTSHRLVPVLGLLGSISLVGCAPEHEGGWQDTDRSTTLIIDEGWAEWTYSSGTTGVPPLGLDFMAWTGEVAETEAGVTLALVCKGMNVIIPGTNGQTIAVQEGCEAAGASNLTVPCKLDGDTLTCVFDGDKKTLFRIK